jgi:hypothetical protein
MPRGRLIRSGAPAQMDAVPNWGRFRGAAPVQGRRAERPIDPRIAAAARSPGVLLVVPGHVVRRSSLSRVIGGWWPRTWWRSRHGAAPHCAPSRSHSRRRRPTPKAGCRSSARPCRRSVAARAGCGSALVRALAAPGRVRYEASVYRTQRNEPRRSGAVARMHPTYPAPARPRPPTTRRAPPFASGGCSARAVGAPLSGRLDTREEERVEAALQLGEVGAVVGEPPHLTG